MISSCVLSNTGQGLKSAQIQSGYIISRIIRMEKHKRKKITTLEKSLEKSRRQGTGRGRLFVSLHPKREKGKVLCLPAPEKRHRKKAPGEHPERHPKIDGTCMPQGEKPYCPGRVMKKKKTSRSHQRNREVLICRFVSADLHQQICISGFAFADLYQRICISGY